MLYTYSLSDYIVSVVVPESLYSVYGVDNRISIGGDKSYNGGIIINMNSQTWTTHGDATGSYYHDKSKDRTGTLTVNLTQISDNVLRLIRLFNAYYSSDSSNDGLTITLSKAIGNDQKIVATCNSCMLNLPNLDFEDAAKQHGWAFTCGEIIFSGVQI